MTEDVKIFKVRVVKVLGDAAIVEWDADGLRRCVIPASMAAPEMDAETLELGAPYGLPWETLVTLSATPEGFAAALRANGIWTLEDVRNNQKAVYGVIQAAYGLDLAALIQAANGYQTKG